MTRPLFLLLFILLTGLAPGASAAPAQKDWSRSVTLTAEGAHLIGNPAAKTRLVEYVSYTCPHCAHFVAEGSEPLRKGWVSRGGVATEIRNLVRDRFDLTAAILARCGGPARFQSVHEAIFAAQDSWLASVRAYASAPTTLPVDATRVELITDIAQKTGLFALLAKKGVAAEKSRACLADEKAMGIVLGMTKRGMGEDHVTGTPSFLINGTLTDAHDWAGLRALLPAPVN